MSSRAQSRQRPGLAPLAAVTAAALIFAVLLVLVRLRWAPLESADHGAAANINRLIAGNAPLVAAVRAVTWLGSDGVLWTVIGVATIVLALRRRWLFLIPAVAMPVLVATSRMYRGEHHPTDIVGSVLFSVLWLTAVSVLVKPNPRRRAEGPVPARRASVQARQAT